MKSALWLVLLCLGGNVASGASCSETARQKYAAQYRTRMVPLVQRAVSFRTLAGNSQALADQKLWIRETAQALGLQYRDAGTVVEVELPVVDAQAPVLGLVVHGDIQPAGEGWQADPFSGAVRDGYIYGRGVADDKGPLVQAMLSMAALRDAGRRRTHRIRLLVGSDEESENKDMAAYLKDNPAPTYSLILDANFPVVVGEKAWDELAVTAADPFKLTEADGTEAWQLTAIQAGTGTSIVPGRAVATLRWLPENTAGLAVEVAKLTAVPPEGFAFETTINGRDLQLVVNGRAAHSGMNPEGGRNALVLLANRLLPVIRRSAARDLLRFASQAGKDLYGAGLGLARHDPLWGRNTVNVATFRTDDKGGLRLAINVRRIPPTTAPQIRAHLERVVADFNRTQGSELVFGAGYFEDEPFFVSPEAKLARRLISIYNRATGQTSSPTIIGGGTYARRVPNSIAFGMWFAETPYPGHDANERILIKDLDRGVDVLLEALCDVGTGAPIQDPLKP